MASRIPLSPLNFLHRRALSMAERTAVVQGDRRYTYAELAERVGRLAGALHAVGVARGDRVAVLCPNSPALLEAHYGVPAAGAILVAVNTRLSAGEVEYIVSDSGAGLLIVDRELAGLAPSGVDTLQVHDTGRPGDPYEDFLAGADPEPVRPWDGDEDDP